MQQLNNQYSLLLKQLNEVLTQEGDFLSQQSQFTALIFNSLEEVSWAGFYWLKADDCLSVGSYQGPIACAKIPLGRGVCGKVAETKQSLVVQDVNQFIDHIACDAGSQSELVCPIVKNNQLLGVFDMDSYKLARFSHSDQQGIEALIKLFVETTCFDFLETDIK